MTRGTRGVHFRGIVNLFTIFLEFNCLRTLHADCAPSHQFRRRGHPDAH
jgi:hypothetical protein